MKGRKSNMCRANGGSAMRDIGGIKAPAYGADTAVMKAAEGKTTGIVDMDGPSGGPAKMRMDRPGRKHGGSVKKADGGAVDGSNRVTSMDEYAADNPPSLADGLRGLGRAMFKGKAFESQTQSEPTRHGDGILLKNFRERKSLQERKSGGKVDSKKHGK